MTVLELFCGIGGFAAALGSRARVVAAVDQNRLALSAYAGNFPHPVFAQSVESFFERPRGNRDADTVVDVATPALRTHSGACGVTWTTRAPGAS